MRRLLPFALLALAVAVGGCDGFQDDDFTPQVVVSATLGAGEPLPTITLSRTSPLLDAYDPASLGVEGATVTVTLLAADGSDESAYAYGPGEAPGQYAPDAAVEVLPTRTYRLDVAVGGDRLRAQTTVPRILTLVEPPPAETVYGTGQGPELRITQTSTAERQTAFVASVRALAPVPFEEVVVDGDTLYRSVPTPGTFGVTPIIERFFGCEAEAYGVLLCDVDPIEEAVVGTSPVINEASYIDLGDGTVLVQIPYLAFGFYGPVQISLVSLDVVMEAFVESQLVQGGGSTLSPGEIPNVTSNIEGGLGLFGSFARVTTQTTLVPAE